MSVESEILRIQHNIANTYAAVSEKGGEVPLQPTSANLAAAVASIPSGSGGTLLNSLNRQIAITQSQWTEVDGVYQCTVPCDGVIANEAVQNIYSTPAASQQSAYEECEVKCVAQGTGTLTYQAKTLPPDLLMYVTIVNAGEMTTNLVAWSPHMTSNTTPAPYVVSTNMETIYTWQLFDGSNDAVGFGYTAGAYVQIDLGEPIVTYGFSVAYGYEFSMPISFTIYGSGDGSIWNVIKNINNGNSYAPGNMAIVTHFFDTPASYRFYRISDIYPKEDDGVVDIRELKFLRPASDVEEVS